MYILHMYILPMYKSSLINHPSFFNIKTYKCKWYAHSPYWLLQVVKIDENLTFSRASDKFLLASSSCLLRLATFDLDCSFSLDIFALFSCINKHKLINITFAHLCIVFLYIFKHILNNIIKVCILQMSIGPWKKMATRK